MEIGESNKQIILRTSIDDLEIEIRLDSQDEIEAAYLSLLDIKKKVREIKQKHRILLIAESAKEKANRFWIQEGDRRTLEGVEEIPITMMLSLLDTFPDCKAGSVVADETRNTHPTVSRYFTGKRGEHSSYFEKCDGSWKLTNDGVTFIAKWLGTETQE